MVITLPISFEPVNEEWAAYCDFALKMLHEHGAESEPQLKWESESGQFTLSGVKYVEHDCHFIGTESFSDTAGLLLSWVRVLGRKPSQIIKPFSDVARKNGEIRRYFLRVRVEGTDSELGLYRLCSSLIFNASKISEPEMELLKSINDRLNS